MPRKTLYKYSEPDGKLKFGITPGSTVLHLIGQCGNDHGEEIDFDKEPDREVYGPVKKSENFINEGDKRTSDFFKELASESERAFASLEGHPDPAMEKILYAIRDYITAESRHSQQANLKILKTLLESYPTHKLDASDGKIWWERQDQLNFYKQRIREMTMGNLQPGPGYRKSKKIKEPADTKWGVYLGHWTKTENVLFPKDPSPNDIKQGVGVQTCFMLSALTQVAATDPQKIKDCMKDNGDGTVTVRFKHKNDETGNFEDVYIDVNKTEKRLFGKGLHMYASSSLWVQMMEKAYAEYLIRYSPEIDESAGLNAINTGSSQDFMQAFLGQQCSGSNDLSPAGHMKNFYNGTSQRPDYYLPEEDDIYDFFDKHVNKGKEIMTVGVIPQLVNINTTADDMKALGLRPKHFYAVRKVFEQKDSTGRIRKFVQLRDPYATFETGYSFVGGNPHLVDRSTLVKSSMKAGNENMGTFNMELTDFLEYFGNIDCLATSKVELDEIASKRRDYSKKELELTKDELEGREKYNYKILEDYKENIKKEREKKKQEKAEAKAMNEASGKPEKKSDNLDFEDVDLDMLTDGDDIHTTEKKEPEIKTDSAHNNDSELMREYDILEVDEFGEIVETDDAVNEKLTEKSMKEEASPIYKLFTGNIVEFGAFQRNIKRLILDIGSTDQWYHYNKEKSFRTLRDNLYKLGKFLDNEGKKQLKKDAPRFVQLVQDVQESAYRYADDKFAAVNKDLEKEKLPSTRTTLRMAAAVKLEAVCSMESNVNMSLAVERTAEDQKDRFTLLVKDLYGYMQSPEKMAKLEKNERQKASFNKAVLTVRNYFRSHLDESAAFASEIGEAAWHDFDAKTKEIEDKFKKAEEAEKIEKLSRLKENTNNKKAANNNEAANNDGAEEILF